MQVNRLKTWSRPGLLCIGDAAHAMSPVGGVGVNLAIQDAVAAANLLAAKLRDNALSDDDVRAVQRRREFPTRVTQALQLAIQNRVVRSVLSAQKPFDAPLALRLLNAIPLLRRLPARLIGLGVRPEHIETRDESLLSFPAGRRPDRESRRIPQSRIATLDSRSRALRASGMTSQLFKRMLYDAGQFVSRIKAPKARGPSPVSAFPRIFSVCASTAQSSFENQLAT